jgi:CheY-like chemotaxis protein
MDKLPCAVWLDYYLKDMNGLAFMQTIKENPKWSHIPVVVVSNSASPEKVNNMLALGAKRYILKAEYRLDEIIQMMRDLIVEAGGGGDSVAAAARLDSNSASSPMVTAAMSMPGAPAAAVADASAAPTAAATSDPTTAPATAPPAANPAPIVDPPATGQPKPPADPA